MVFMTAENDSHKVYLWTIQGTWWVDWTPKSKDGLASGFQYFESFEDALGAMPIKADDYVPYTTKDQRT